MVGHHKELKYWPVCVLSNIDHPKNQIYNNYLIMKWPMLNTILYLHNQGSLNKDSE